MTERLLLVADKRFRLDLAAQGAILQWWLDHLRPSDAEIVTLGGRGLESSADKLVDSSIIAIIPMRQVDGRRIADIRDQRAIIGRCTEVLVLKTSRRGEKRTRRILRWARWLHIPIRALTEEI